ncbi:MAG: hypothetical protein ABH950_07750 [Candidatus Altiarchaeota archaeon]
MKIWKNKFSGADTDLKSESSVEEKNKKWSWTGTFFLDEETGEGKIVFDDVPLQKQAPLATLTPSQVKNAD